jgi:hypothetical protein
VLKHLSGKKNVTADTLSRREDHISEKDTNNEDIIMLPDALFINFINIDLRDQILAINDKDEPVMKALETLKSQGEAHLKEAIQDWQINDSGLLVYKNRCYILPNLDLC